MKCESRTPLRLPYNPGLPNDTKECSKVEKEKTVKLPTLTEVMVITNTAGEFHYMDYGIHSFTTSKEYRNLAIWQKVT